jgi:hypothetical protein
LADATSFAEAMLSFTDHLATLAGAVAMHKKKLTDEFGFSEMAAESMCIHVHMKMVELMCITPPILRR